MSTYVSQRVSAAEGKPPEFAEPDRVPVSVVQEAYVQGVSSRRVDELVKALGMTGISKSQVSRLCEELDSEVEQFRSRRLCEEYPYVWLDATFLKVRQEGRVVSTAVVIATSVTVTGEREVLRLDVCPSEDGGTRTPTGFPTTPPFPPMKAVVCAGFAVRSDSRHVFPREPLPGHVRCPVIPGMAGVPYSSGMPAWISRLSIGLRHSGARDGRRSAFLASSRFCGS